MLLKGIRTRFSLVYFLIHASLEKCLIKRQVTKATLTGIGKIGQKC
jgi:hypothetical protein